MHDRFYHADMTLELPTATGGATVGTQLPIWSSVPDGGRCDKL